MEPGTFSHPLKQYQASDRSRSSASREWPLSAFGTGGDRADARDLTKSVTVESDLER